ncbi:MAG: MBOAT family protein, partial [Alphaproteobacteria bacterium]|nr:MBOAT family protein [Alphaproteobacteria bacterium]
MVFGSPQFLFLFLPFALLVYAATPRRGRNLALLLVSLLFYAWGEAGHLWLLLALIAVNWVAGLAIAGTESPLQRRLAVSAAIATDLAALVWFKYAMFLGHNLARLGASAMALDGIVLPLGISFFVFHNISYVVDIYRRVAPPRRNPIDFALYIAFFPQLIAGPIVRYHDIAAALDNRRVTAARFASGTERFLAGLAKKMLLANPLGATTDRIFAVPHAALPAELAWLGIACYTLQIYLDFSGYSDMAIGLARMFGFEFLENFNYPYISTSIQEFWRRWHISLSNWFREYVYIPLGGNRGGELGTWRNLVIVFLLCGFWHGANWTFLVWGMIHGAFLVAERAGLSRLLARAPVFLRHLYVMAVVVLAWVFFRSENLVAAGRYLRALLGLGHASGAMPIWYYLDRTTALALMIGAMVATPAFSWITRDWRARAGQWRGAALQVVGGDGAVLIGARTAMLL